MLNLKVKAVVVTKAGLFIGPEETVTEDNRHHFNHDLVERFTTGSPAFLQVENRYSEPTVPSGINRETVEEFFNGLVDEHFRLPGNVEDFIDEIVAGKTGYGKLRKGSVLHCYTFASFEISEFIPRKEKV